jgi:hypothetical protein
MSITIDKFVTRCRVPPQHRAVGSLANHIVRERFAAECSRRLNSLPASESKVIRIRRLPLQLKVSAAHLNEQEITRVWVDAFIKQLLVALNGAPVSEKEILIASSRTEWLARFIFDLMSGTAASQWEYEEFADVLKLGTVDAVLTTLQREPIEIIPVLLLLQNQRRLDRLLMLFGDFAYEQLFAIIARSQIRKELEPTIADLLAVGELAKSESPAAGVLATRRRALLIFLELAKSNETTDTSYWSPRRVLYALIALDTLINVSQTLPPEMWESQLTPQFLARTGRSLNPTIFALFEQIRLLAAERTQHVREQKLVPLLRLVRNLAMDVISNTDLQKPSYWVSGDCVGFLLLAGLIDRFRWPQHILESELGRTWGNRAVVSFLAGLAQHLLGKDPDDRDLDPGVAVFAGWLKPASADVHVVQTILSSATNEDRANLIRALDLSPGNDGSIALADWTTTFDYLSNQIVREFASRVRGFRKATPAFIVNTFLKQAGRICIDDKRILVILQPNPFHVALHISSMDEPVESVSWLENRRLEFQLEGL